MRFITRTLPWIVILVVIAFFIGLKQSSNRMISSAVPSVEKTISKEKAEAPSKESAAKKDASEAASVKEESDKEESDTQPKPMIIIDGAVVTEKTSDSGSTDSIDIKLFEEEATDAKSEDKADEKADSKTKDDSEDAKPSEKDPSSKSTVSWFDTPILLSMNPPVLGQPINGAKSDWNWSEMVKSAESDDDSDDSGDSATESGATTATDESATDSSSDESSSEDSSSVESQGEMPSMYGPAKENVNNTDEATDDSDEASEETSASSTTSTGTTDASDEDASDEDAEGASSSDQPAEESSEETDSRKPLSPEMQKLRDGVRSTIDAYSKPLLNTQDNTVAQLLDVCEAYGCDAEVMFTDKKRKINAFANLCYNYPCAGYRPLKVTRGRVVPRLGYGFQSAPGQMLAVMALARVPETYTLQFNEKVTGTVADLVRRERETCRRGGDLAFKLIGISRYTPSDEEWKSEDGKTWTVQKLLNEVLDQPSRLNSVAGTNRLLAISYAVDRRLKRGEPLDGVYARADKYIKDFQDYALSMINDDGTWHPRFFQAKGKGSQNQGRLRSTGHILRWLVFSLPEERLQDPRIVKAIYQVNRSLGGNTRYSLASASSRSIDSRLTAVHALVLYNNRLFKPYDAMDKEIEVIAKKAEEKKEVK